MNLQRHQYEQLQAAICECFAASDLKRLALEVFGRPLERIVANVLSLDEQVRELIGEAERRNVTARLVAAAGNERPDHPLMQALLRAAVHWPACCVGGLTVREGKAYCFAPRETEIAYLTGLLARLKPLTAGCLPLAADFAPQGRAAAVSRVPDAAGALQGALEALYPEARTDAVSSSPPSSSAGAGNAAAKAAPDPCAHEGRRALFLLLGDAGAGKTAVLQQTARLLAQSAQKHEALPLPVYVAPDAVQGGLLSPVGAGFGSLRDDLWAYLAHGRAVLLLDGLDALPAAPDATTGEPAAQPLEQLAALLADETFALPLVAARRSGAGAALDPFAPARLTLTPLDFAAQRRFLRHWLPPTGDEDRGGAALAKLAGGEAQLAEAERWGKSAPLLELYSTPRLLRLLADAHAGDVDLLRFNCAQLAAEYVRGVLVGTGSRLEWDHPHAAALEAALGAAAYALRQEGNLDTALRAWASARLEADPARAAALLAAAQRAGLLTVGEDGTRFTTPLLADYFAAVGWRRAWEDGRKIAASWPGGWWLPSPWDAPAVLLTGLLDSGAEPFVAALLPLNPVLAARCIGESGAGPFENELVNTVTAALTAAVESRDLPAAARCAAGDALNYVGDPRRGVGVPYMEGVPDIDWRDVPGGAFVAGGEPFAPVAQVEVEPFAISRYPITNAQFAAFVADGGYTEARRACWSDAGWAWRERRRPDGPKQEGGVYDLPNHPAVSVSYYEAEAFCCWLGRKLHARIALPSGAQWEKAARGADGRQYPHGDRLAPDDANYAAAGLHATSAVGVFPRSESPCGVMDTAGNVWEWTAAEPGIGTSSSTGSAQRIVRGGAYDSAEVSVRCASRALRPADSAACNIGFRVVKVAGAADEPLPNPHA